MTYLAGDSAGVEESGGPRPLRHDSGGRQSHAHATASVERRIQCVLWREHGH